MNKTWMLIGAIFSALLSTQSVAGSAALDELLQVYAAQATLSLDAQRGATFWQSAGPNETRCSSCHGVDTKTEGKHLKTGKLIEPLAPSVNADRLQDVNTIEKWLFRNCKAVWSRECTAQEKGDVLLWLGQQ